MTYIVYLLEYEENVKKHSPKFHEELESKNTFDIKIKNNNNKRMCTKLSIVGSYTFKSINIMYMCSLK